MHVTIKKYVIICVINTMQEDTSQILRQKHIILFRKIDFFLVLPVFYLANF